MIASLNFLQKSINHIAATTVRRTRRIAILAFSYAVVILPTLDAAPLSDRVHRSPVDVAISADGQWLVSANQTSNSISLIRLSDGTIADEQRVGNGPVSVQWSFTSNLIYVVSANAGEVSVWRLSEDQLAHTKTIHVDGSPYGIAVTRDGRFAFVSLSALDEVVQIALGDGAIVSRIPVGRWPRYLALSPDETRLAVGTSGDRGVSIVDVSRRELIHIDRFVGLNIGHVQISKDGKFAYFPWMVYRRNPITAQNIRLGWVLASRMARLSIHGESRREAISLDPPGRAVADPFGIALTSDEKWMVISASGTHELLVLRNSDLPYLDHGSTDHIDPTLVSDADRFSRIELGGRPMGLRIGADQRTVYVANYLNDSVQVVDIVSRRLLKSISLGDRPEMSLARKGEVIFYDAKRSLDQWYSCHSCHMDGGTNAVAMDTDNDSSSFTYKTVLPLQNVRHTGPWTWHGWQTSLDAAMRKSLSSTMMGPTPSDEDVAALNAFLDSLQLAPKAVTSTSHERQLIEVGRVLFESSWTKCSDCHTGQYFTDGQIHDVGLGQKSDRYEGFNTPSLLRVSQKVKFLHDGRCATLDDVLAGPHSPAIVSGTRNLSDEELRALVAYLKTL